MRGPGRPETTKLSHFNAQTRIHGGGGKGSMTSLLLKGGQEYFLTPLFWEDKLKSLLHSMADTLLFCIFQQSYSY